MSVFIRSVWLLGFTMFVLSSQGYAVIPGTEKAMDLFHEEAVGFRRTADSWADKFRIVEQDTVSLNRAFETAKSNLAQAVAQGATVDKAMEEEIIGLVESEHAALLVDIVALKEAMDGSEETARWAKERNDRLERAQTLAEWQAEIAASRAAKERLDQAAAKTVLLVTQTRWQFLRRRSLRLEAERKR